jgi:hypothetical protein
VLPFTQRQANEVGGVVHDDGLDIVLARALCEKWTRIGSKGNITFEYRLEEL